MIIVRNRELNSETVEILNELIEKDISAVYAFRLMNIIKDLDDIIKNRQQSELNLLKKFAVKNEDGTIKVPKDDEGNPIQGNFEIAEENKEKFNKEINDLLEYENNLQHEPMSFEDLGIEKISVKKLMKLSFLFNIPA